MQDVRTKLCLGSAQVAANNGLHLDSLPTTQILSIIGSLFYLLDSVPNFVASWHCACSMQLRKQFDGNRLQAVPGFIRWGHEILHSIMSPAWRSCLKFVSDEC